MVPQSDGGADRDAAADPGRDEPTPRGAAAPDPPPERNREDADRHREPGTPEGPGPTEGPAPGEQPRTWWPQGYTPTRADTICLGLLVFSGVFGLVLLVLRPWLLGHSPLLLASLTGSRSALVTIGAQAATGHPGVWLVAFVLSSLSLIKFDLVYWWAGRLWGDWFIAGLVGDSPRAAKRAQRGEALARRFDIVAVAVSHVPFVPIPPALIYAVLGASGSRLRRFFVVDLAAGALLQATWLLLGYRIGQPVIDVVEVIAKYSLWLSLAILVGVVWASVRKARREAGEGSPGARA